MRTTINFDDALLDRARELSGLKERSALRGYDSPN